MYFYDQKRATRCLDANRGSALSLKFTYAKGRLPSTIVASLGRYHASRILSIDHVPQKFDVKTPQELAPNGVESFHYDESDAQLEIRFFDTSKAFKAGFLLHDHIVLLLMIILGPEALLTNTRTSKSHCSITFTTTKLSGLVSDGRNQFQETVEAMCRNPVYHIINDCGDLSSVDELL